jgi:hypothetical protein
MLLDALSIALQQFGCFTADLRVGFPLAVTTHRNASLPDSVAQSACSYCVFIPQLVNSGNTKAVMRSIFD